jgi:hypothetical protein
MAYNFGARTRRPPIAPSTAILRNFCFGRDRHCSRSRDTVQHVRGGWRDAMMLKIAAFSWRGLVPEVVCGGDEGGRATRCGASWQRVT